ncbi:mCG1035622 [Mus musculus]|nr:mCG1035622 [Mus musculus]
MQVYNKKEQSEEYNLKIKRNAPGNLMFEPWPVLKERKRLRKGLPWNGVQEGNLRARPHPGKRKGLRNFQPLKSNNNDEKQLCPYDLCSPECVRRGGSIATTESKSGSYRKHTQGEALRRRLGVGPWQTSHLI